MKKFNTAFQGYSKKEVDLFLNKIADEYQELLNKLKLSDEKKLLFEKELEKYKVLETSLNKAIMLAEEAGHTIKKTAFQESQIILEDAKANASKIVNNALLKAEKIEEESTVLKRRVAVFKKRFRNLVEEHLDEIEKFDDFL